MADGDRSIPMCEVTSGLIDEVKVLQDRALNQHENYLNSTSKVHKFESGIKELCLEIKKLRTKNAERHSQIDKVASQNTELKKLIVKEESMAAAVDMRKNQIEEEIAAIKSEFLIKLREHEVRMSENAIRFTSAPHEFGFKRMNADTDNFRVKKMELTNKTQKNIMAEKNKKQMELAKAEGEVLAAKEIGKMLDEAGLKARLSSMKICKSELIKKIQAREKAKAELEKKVHSIYNGQ